VFLRRRRQTSRRIGFLATGLVAYLLSLAPIAGTVIYCISEDGHSGFEVVAQTERGCASCCHDTVEAAGNGGLEQAPIECIDIALSSPELIPATTAAGPGFDVLPHSFLHTLATPAATHEFRAARERTAHAPPRSAASVLVRHTVLLI